MEKQQEFIWYCPRTCNGVLMKTTSPFLHEGKFQCKRCLTIFTTIEIMVRNRKNLITYYKYLGEVKTRWAIKEVGVVGSFEDDLTPET